MFLDEIPFGPWLFLSHTKVRLGAISPLKKAFRIFSQHYCFNAQMNKTIFSFYYKAIVSKVSQCDGTYPLVIKRYSNQDKEQVDGSPGGCNKIK